MDKTCAEALAQIEKADKGDICVTCPASRHVRMIGESLARGQPYAMLQEEPEHCAGSMLATVAALYETRRELLQAQVPKKTSTKREAATDAYWTARRCGQPEHLALKAALNEALADEPASAPRQKE